MRHKLLMKGCDADCDLTVQPIRKSFKALPSEPLHNMEYVSSQMTNGQ